MLPDIQPGNTKILYFFNCLLDGMHTRPANSKSFMWVYRSGKYHTDRVIILYEYQKTRKAEQEEIIKGIEDGLTDKKK